MPFNTSRCPRSTGRSCAPNILDCTKGRESGSGSRTAGFTRASSSPVHGRACSWRRDGAEPGGHAIEPAAPGDGWCVGRQFRRRFRQPDHRAGRPLSEDRPRGDVLYRRASRKILTPATALNHLDHSATIDEGRVYRFCPYTALSGLRSVFRWTFTPVRSRKEKVVRLNRQLVTALVMASCASLVLGAQGYTVSRTGVFAPQNKKVLLLQNPAGQKPIILFQTTLRVNTDGSPLSYHPQDPRGRDKALNNICNAIVVKKVGSDVNLCRTSFGAAIGVFEKFRDANYQTVPDGFRITWANVLATTKSQGRHIPCVFASGAFQGYFGSLTALTNGLTGDKGECDVKRPGQPDCRAGVGPCRRKKRGEGIWRRSW